MKFDPYYSFIFKGLLTEEALDRGGRNKKMGNGVIIEKEIYERLPFELIDEELLTASRRMATIFAILNAFENSLRRFITKKLQEEFKEEWWEKGISEKIRKAAETRKNEEEKIKWHTQRGSDFMSYIEFGHLEDTIEKNWSLFEPHLQLIEWVKSILKPLERSRNVIMHSGELDKEDMERIGTLMRDWFAQVGS